LPSRFFKRDDAHEFKPALAEIEERPASPLARVVFWLVVAALVFFVFWAYLGRVDVVVTARGMVIPEGEVKVLQPLDAGVVSAILCREGDPVKKGQVLMEIDPSTMAPELDSRRRNLRLIELEKSRLRAHLDGSGFDPNPKGLDRDALKKQKEMHEATIVAYERQIDAKTAEFSRVEEAIQSARKERDLNRSFLETARAKKERLDAVSDIIAKGDHEKAVNEMLGYASAAEQAGHKVEELKHERSRLKSELDYLRSSFRVDRLKEYTERDKESTGLRAEVDKTAFRTAKQKILSPVDGHVVNLFVHTVGGVVTPAEKLLAVAPSGAPLIVKAAVLNKDIGFVKEGMEVILKVDAFDFQKYGVLKGVVRTVSKHSVTDEKLGPVYDVYVTPLETSLVVEGRKVALGSGMSLSVEIKVDKRRIIEFFLYPIIKYLDEGMKVR
jgi:hemolysin D